MEEFGFKAEDAKQDGKHAWLPIKVPSHGHKAFYQERFPDGACSVRKLKIHEESILHTQGMDAVERIKLISQNCVRLPQNLTPDNLLSTDRVAILLYQRCFSYGRKYTFNVTCRCRAQTPTTIDMFKDLSYRSPDDVEADRAACNDLDFQHADPFTVILDDAGTEVDVRFMRGSDENEIVRRSKAVRGQRGDLGDPAYVFGIVQQIANVRAIPEWSSLPVGRKEIWVRELTGADRTRITMAVDERGNGYQYANRYCMPRVRRQIQIALPFDIEFFQPSTL